jgi:hypothetical protein
MQFPQIQHIPSWLNLQHKHHEREILNPINLEDLSLKHLLQLCFL